MPKNISKERKRANNTNICTYILKIRDIIHRKSTIKRLYKTGFRFLCKPRLQKL